MSYISEALRACEVMLERAARNGFAVQTTKGSLHGSATIRRTQNRSQNTRAWLRERRNRAVELYAAGWTAVDIAAQLGCGKSLVFAAVRAARPVRIHA